MNFNNFKGGLSDLKSIYQIGKGETTAISNLDIELGGLKLRDGTKKKYGPFNDKIKNMQTAIDSYGNEYVFIETESKVKVAINNYLSGIEYNNSNNTKVIFEKTSYKIRIGELLYYPAAFFGRKSNGNPVTVTTDTYFYLNPIDTDYYTDGDFPENLKGKAIIDSDTDIIYIGIGNVIVDKNNIHANLATANFFALGKLGTHIRIWPRTTAITVTVDLLNLDPTKIYLNVLSSNSIFYYKMINSFSSATAKEAMKCNHIVWHPSSMRYFAAGHPTNKCALYVSQPDNIESFSESNILYPHLSKGEITSLSIVERSVLVGYEHGWSHYVGSDPTMDAQWSLLSVPDGCRIGRTVQTTPNSVTFYSDNGIVLFSTSILTIQSVFAPNSLMYKYISKNEIEIEGNAQTSFYYNGKYYLATDKRLYIYSFELGAFTVYDGLNITCMVNALNGKILMGSGNYILEFDGSSHTDFDALSGTEKAIAFDVCFPVTNACYENEIGRIENVCFKGQGVDGLNSAALTVESEFMKSELDLKDDKYFSYKKSDWDKLHYAAALTESFFTVDMRGNVFFISLSGETDPQNPQVFFVKNIFVGTKKERNKIC